MECEDCIIKEQVKTISASNKMLKLNNLELKAQIKKLEDKIQQYEKCIDDLIKVYED